MWQPLPVRLANGFGMKVARRPCCSAMVFDHELEERVAVGGDQGVVVQPVHLELAVRVLVVVLIRPQPSSSMASQIAVITS